MTDIRKYITLVENAEKLDEGSRHKALQYIENNAYILLLHCVKLVYMPDSDSSNHWKVEVKTFVNGMVKKNIRGKLKDTQVYELLTSDNLAIQVRNKMVNFIHDNYGYVTIDVNDLVTIIDTCSKILSGYIANGSLIDYNDIDEIISTFDYI